MVRKHSAALLVLLLVISITACDKGSDPMGDIRLSRLKVTMHDTAGPYDAVYVEIIGVNAHVTDVDNDSGQWVSLEVNPGIYDLLELQDGVDTVIVNESILPHGKLSQLRLILGDENSVVIDSVTHPLTTPSAQTSGLKINIHKTIEPGSTYDLILDFDANSSIVQTENGSEYQLKPVIKVDAIIEINE